MTSFGDKNYQGMVEKFGVDTASDILWLEEMACCLYQPPKKSMLVVDLRAIVKDATALADKIESEMEVCK